MSETGETNPQKYGSNTRLSTAIDTAGAQELATLVQKSRSEHLAAEDKHLRNYKGLYKHHEITDKERADIFLMLSDADQKLEQLGVKQADCLLPSIKEVSVIVSRDPNLGRGETGGYGEYLRLYVKPNQAGQPFDRPVFFHELFHYIARKAVKKRVTGQDDPSKFEPISQGITPVAYGKAVGIPFEGVAELFALFCIDKPVGRVDDVLKQYPRAPIAYTREFAFTSALIKEYSTRTKQLPRHIIEVFLKAAIEGDYSFYKDLANVFGITATRKINKLRGRKEKMIEVAKDCGFLDDFTGMELALSKGKSIILPGLKLRIKERHPDPVSSYDSEEILVNWNER